MKGKEITQMTREVTIHLSDEQVIELRHRARIEDTSLEELVTRIVENDIVDSINSVPSVELKEESNSQQVLLNQDVAANEATSTEVQRRNALRKENEVKLSRHDGSEGRPNP